MSKMLEIESCWVCPRFKDLTCLLHREVQQPDKKITDNIHPDCPLPNSEKVYTEEEYQYWLAEIKEEIKEHIIRDTEKRVVDEVVEFLNIELVVNQSGYGEALNKLRKKYNVQR